MLQHSRQPYLLQPLQRSHAHTLHVLTPVRSSATSRAGLCKHAQRVLSAPPTWPVKRPSTTRCAAKGPEDECRPGEENAQQASDANSGGSEKPSKPGGLRLDVTPQTTVTAVLLAGFFLIGILAQRAFAGSPSATVRQQPQVSSSTITTGQLFQKMAKNPDTLEVAHYRLLQAFNFPTYGKILALLAVGVPLVVIGAFAYRKTTGKEWPDALWKSYSIAADVPGSEINEETPMANLVCSALHIFSLCTFAVLVGVFTSEIEGAVEALKTGNFPLPETGHTVVLGWNSRQGVTLLKEILEARSQRGTQALQPPIVVLGEESKEDMDAVLMNEFGDVVNRVVVTRQGNSTRPLDLARVSTSRAKTVLWMAPDEMEMEHKNVDISTALSATLASLHSLRQPISPPQRVIVCEDGAGILEGWDEAPSGRMIKNNLLARGSKITSLADLSNLNGIMAQVALQPGLSVVFEEVCQHTYGKNEFYSMVNPSNTDITFRQARKSFPHAVLVGLVDANTGVTHLSPSDEYVIAPNDSLLLLSEGSHTLTYKPRQVKLPNAEEAAAAEKERQLVCEAAPFKHMKNGKNTTPQQRQQELHKPEHVVVLGFGNTVKRLAGSLSDFCAPGSKVTLAMSDDPSSDTEFKRVQSAFGGLNMNGVSFSVMRGNLSSNDYLRRAGVTEADSVILGSIDSSTGWDPADVDAQMVATTLQLHSLLDDDANKYLDAQASQDKKRIKSMGCTDKLLRGNKPLSVVTCVAEERTKEVLKHLVAPKAAFEGKANVSTPTTQMGSSRGLALQVIITQELMSGMLTQVASDPMLMGLFEDLLRDEGSELYMRTPEVYGVPLGVQKTWDEVQDAVREANGIVIGLLDAGGNVRLGVDANERLELKPSEKLVVISNY